MQGELAQLGNAPVRQGGLRILVLADGQQCGKEPDVLLEQIEDGGDPSFAEPHPWPYPLCLELLRPGVGGLLEQGDTGLVPELVTEQER